MLLGLRAWVKARGEEGLLHFWSVSQEKRTKEPLLLESSWADAQNCEAKALQEPIDVLTSQQNEEKTVQLYYPLVYFYVSF